MSEKIQRPKLDKLQRYAASKVRNKEKDIIISKDTMSAYYNFSGSILRISDHLARENSGATMSIIITSDPNQYVLNHYPTGTLSVVNYSQAKEIVRTFGYVTDVFRKPESPFALEKEVIDTLTGNGNASAAILGLPASAFTDKQLSSIHLMWNQAKQNLDKNREKAMEHEKNVKHMLHLIK